MQKKNFSKSFWKDGVYQLQCCGSLDFVDADSSDSRSSGEEKDDIYGYRRPCIRVRGPDPVNSDTDKGSQEDDRGKLVFLLSFSSKIESFCYGKDLFIATLR